jgi:uncharacterized protein with GYD domain
MAPRRVRGCVRTKDSQSKERQLKPMEGMMRLHSLMIASALAMGLAVPAMAQSSTMHRYVQFFKYSDAAVKEMTENPQDRAATLAKLYESAGGKMESIYWFPTGGQYDGMVIGQFPDDVSAEAISLTVRSTGSLANSQTVAAMTAEEFKAAMEKAKNMKSNYTPPTATKQ